jgi:hypothetical protein
VYGMKQAGRGAVWARRPFGGFPLGLAPVLIALLFLALASSGPYFPLFPLISLLFVFVFFVAPEIRRFVARGGLDSHGPLEVRLTPDRKEKELLRVLDRREEITAARAALETPLSIAEAERILTKLASGGHVEVRARGGTLVYALRAVDRYKAGSKEIGAGADAGSLG